MQYQLGNRQLEMDGHYLDANLRSSNDILDQPEAIRERLKEDGYLLIRQLHDRSDVLEMRRKMVEDMASRGVLDPDADIMLAKANIDKTKWAKSPSVETYRKELPDLLEALGKITQSSKLHLFFEKLFGEPVTPFDTSWLRTTTPGGAGGLHYDVVYMGRGETENLCTCWTPIGDVDLNQGPLAMWIGSNHLDELKETYGKLDVDRDMIEPHFHDPIELVDRHGGKWSTTTFKAGDVLIFGMYTMHAALHIKSDCFRLSSDTRYQPASGAADERWIGEKPIGHTNLNDDKRTPIGQAREVWGV